MNAAAASQPVASESPVETVKEGAKLRRRFQIGLRDVAVWVAGAAVFSYFARRWVERWAGDNFSYLAFVYPLLSFGVMILGMFIAFRLASQVVGLARGSIDLGGGGTDVSPRAVAAAIVWRLLAALTVVAMMAEVVAGLNSPQSMVYRNKSDVPRNQAWDDILPLFGLVVIVGILLGMRPAGARTRGPARSAWFSAILAGALSVACLVGPMVLPHLVIVAMEAVTNAQRLVVTKAFDRGDVPTAVALDALPDVQRLPLPMRASLVKRINGAGLPGGLALVSVLATGVWIGRDLRHAASDVAAKALSLRRLFYRIATFTAMVASATYLLGTTIPWIHVSLSAGISRLLGPKELAVVLVAIASLSAGVVARAVGRRRESIAPDGPSISGYGQRLGRAAICLALFGVILLGVAKVGRIIGNVWILGTWDRLADAVAVVMSSWDLLWGPPLPLAFWVPALAWAFCESLRLCGPWAPDRLTAFDAVVLSWSNAGRFIGLCAALTMLCVCALPAIFVVALVAYHVRLMGLH